MAERNSNNGNTRGASQGVASMSRPSSGANEEPKKIAKVDSVLIKNNATRKEMLKRVYWKDKQYTDFAGVDYVRDIEVTNREVKSITDGQELMEYTLGNGNEYSKDILKRNFSNEVNHHVYEMRQVPNGELWKWYGDYFENNTWDSKLFQIGQIKLSEGKIRNKTANDDRFLEQKYITPALLKFYGNKIDAQYGIMQYTLSNHSDGLVNAGTGRMGDISEADVKIEDDINAFLEKSKNALRNYAQSSDSIENSDVPVRQYLAKSIEAAKREEKYDYKTPDNQYVEYTKDKKLFERAIIDDTEISDNTYRKLNNELNSEVYTVFNEKDEAYGLSEGIHDIQYSEGEGTEETFESPFTPTNGPKGLLAKTNKLFTEHKIATLIGRFHTTLSDDGVDVSPTAIDSAISKYGNSHGRNLLTRDAEKGGESKQVNGYDNPYCRTWTYHHQYGHMNDLIRPFSIDDKVLDAQRPYNAIYPNSSASNGISYLRENTVLGSTGHVKIAPKSKGCGTSTTEIKRCMFSIENLAWKDVPRSRTQDGFSYLSDEQRGPNGGRIMWFPPYDLDFQENVSVNWNQNTFIGRGEPVFTYANTNRSGTLSFAILVDHPSIIDNIPKNGIKESEVTESDILRFFAGCAVPDLQKVGDCSSEKGKDKEKLDNEPRPVPDTSKCKHIVFYVYFPNNYSGYQYEVAKKNYKQNPPTDRLWFDYLLMGVNNGIPKNFDEQRGYEISSNNNEGISTKSSESGSTQIKEEGAVYSNTIAWKPGWGTVSNKVWYTYKVDFDSHQTLVNKNMSGKTRGMEYNTTNYADSKSFGLNLNKDIYIYGEKKASEGATYSFAQVMGALYTANSSKLDDGGAIKNFEYFKPEYQDQYHIIPDENDDLLNIANGSKTNSVVSITINGCATLQDTKNTDKLAERRAEAVKQLLKQYIPDDNLYFVGICQGEKLVDSSSTNTIFYKAQRYVKVDIAYDAPQTGVTSDTEQVDNTNNETPTNNDAAANNVANQSEPVTLVRYENEADYFKELNEKDPILFKNLVKKFKYFSPAFHSISPEGFNARLTFLQQCTRQGHTIEASETNGFAKTAGNLSFGRMPVCVLRLGDFLNTKILINGISFSYGASGPMQWDLNPEGIGVQPMYVKVSMQITLLGGQSLEGPINRLQNAVTFNYYANTGVYDNRSDRITIDGGYVSETDIADADPVRVVKEKAGETVGYFDESEYYKPEITYKNIFTPYPKVKKKDVKLYKDGKYYENE